jgi:hypothetical protein
MTTTSSGGKITGLLALTFATDVALNVGDFVHVVGAYKVAAADGTKPIIGHVSVRSVIRQNVSGVSTSFPVATTTGGQVTVEVYGFGVKQHSSGAAITAGALVGINSSGALVPAGTSIANVGVALTAATAASQNVDVLYGIKV